jgi:hypothetical protein
MRWRSSPEATIAGLADASLEGAWLALVYLYAQPFQGDGQQHLGIAALSVAALAGLLFARLTSDVARETYTLVGMGLTIVVAAIGVFAFLPDLARVDPWAALKAHPGGLLAGVAFLRGSAHAEAGAEAGNLERILGIGLVGLVVFWMITTLTAFVEVRSFTEPALVASITFVTATLLALGLARLGSLGSEGVGRATRRRWMALLIGVLGVALVVSLPLAAVLGVPLAAAFAGVLGPLGAVAYGLLILVTLPFAFVAGWLAEIFARMPALQEILAQMANSPAASNPPNLDNPLTPGNGSIVGGLLLATAVIAVVLFVIVRMLGRITVRTQLADATEVRTLELPTPQLRMPRFHLPALRHDPRNAREAYLAVLDLLRGTDASRISHETPAEHARRVGATDVRRLAADYQLDAFAGRTLTAPEERRALVRWRRFRRR